MDNKTPNTNTAAAEVDQEQPQRRPRLGTQNGRRTNDNGLIIHVYELNSRFQCTSTPRNDKISMPTTATGLLAELLQIPLTETVSVRPTVRPDNHSKCSSSLFGVIYIVYKRITWKINFKGASVSDRVE